MSNNHEQSRVNRHQKKQKQLRLIMYLSGLAVLICLVFVSWVFISSKEEANAPTQSQAELATKQDGNSDVSEADEEAESKVHVVGDDESSDTEEIDMDDADIEEVDTDDDNVEKAYEGNWHPLETSQTGDHVTNYDDGSPDRKEIKQAVSIATGVEEDGMIEHWIGNGGDQKVEATISDEHQNYYRVYLSWINEEGWQVDRVETLKQLEK